MSVIDTLRPISVRKVGAGVSVPSGTLAAVTSDNSDSTYIQFPDGADPDSNWSLRVEGHTPDAGYERHRVRGRIRIRADAGSATEDIDLGRGTSDFIQYTSVTFEDSFVTLPGDWFSDAGFGLATPGELADLNIGGGYINDIENTATEGRTAECYVDIDCRLQPQYSPEVRDNAGVDQSGGTITDTTQPVLYFGTVGYDDLPPLEWVATVTWSGGTPFSTSGTGEPPSTVPVTANLDDGSYTATFTVRSTIRGSDPFEHTQVLTFDIENVIPPPSPPLLTVTPAFGGYQVSWTNPGGQTWDSDYAVAELWRDDCTGSQRIATIPDGLNGSYLDLAIPQTDSEPVLGPDGCVVETSGCDVTYRVRYWGYVSTTVELPDIIPTDLILAWPGNVASIPSGWLRVTDLDTYYPRGATGTGAPSATGGSASHSHTTPGHRHAIGAHSHTLGGNTAGNGTSTTTHRFNGADQPTANQSHNHPLPASTGTAVAFSSAFTSPATNAVANDPPTLNVIWIRPDGTPTAYPVGVLGWSTENISGWAAHVESRGRFLRGTTAAGPGGSQYGSETHLHTVDAHTHTSAGHDHTISDTGLSNPAATTEAETGGTSPRWLPRHTHPMNVVPEATGTLTSTSGGNTSSSTREPLHRRLRVLRNSGGGAQTRIIGLYNGAVADLDPVLTLCNGGGGTPDMRGYFCRDIGTGSVNSIGGSNQHNHTTGSHRHGIPAHRHETNTGTSRSRSYERKTSDDQGSVPTTAHLHDTGDTANTTPSISTVGSGITNTQSHVPPYKEVHFVRVDGTVAGGDLPVPEMRISEYASVTVEAFTHDDGLDRISSLTERRAVVTDRSHSFPRLVNDSTPLDGGVHSVSTTEPGEDLALVIATQGKQEIDELEELLAADRIYWSPVGGVPGWFAVGPWTVSGPAPDVKVVQVSLVRQPWPTTPDPEEYL